MVEKQILYDLIPKKIVRLVQNRSAVKMCEGFGKRRITADIRRASQRLGGDLFSPWNFGQLQFRHIG